jgi:hypothetical protein
MIEEKICPICNKENNSIWDYCLKCMKDLGYERCFNIEQIKKGVKA